MRIPRATLSIALSLASVSLAACEQAPPANVQVDVVFPSTALAIASDDVKLVVYDDAAPDACQRIYLKHITNQVDLPPVLLDPPPVAVCDLALGKKPSLEVPLGKHAILAVAHRGDQDLLVGCSNVTLTSDGGEVAIDLTLPETTPLPPLSACTSVRDACAGRCK